MHAQESIVCMGPTKQRLSLLGEFVIRCSTVRKTSFLSGSCIFDEISNLLATDKQLISIFTDEEPGLGIETLKNNFICLSTASVYS